MLPTCSTTCLQGRVTVRRGGREKERDAGENREKEKRIMLSTVG